MDDIRNKSLPKMLNLLRQKVKKRVFQLQSDQQSAP